MRAQGTTRLANVRRYAYLDTRVSGLSARLLGTGETGRDDDTVSTGQEVTSALLDELAVLVRGTSGADRDFLVYWAHRFELRNLKALIRGKMGNVPSRALRGELLDMGPFATLPIEQLLETDDVAELLRRLERTPHADVARHARLIHDERHELFAVDAAIDKRYYTELAERAARIDPHDAPLFHELFGTRMDRVNLVWLLRYRFAYELPPIQTSYLLVPGGLRLDIPTLEALAQLGSFEDVIRNLPGSLRSELAGAVNAFDVTLSMEAKTRRVARAALRMRFGFTPAFAYLLLREGDLRRARALREGARLALSPAAIRDALGLEEQAP